MIGQYFSQTNESATVPVLQKNLELNKAMAALPCICMDASHQCPYHQANK
jgi:hypothetical protein